MAPIEHIADGQGAAAMVLTAREEDGPSDASGYDTESAEQNPSHSTDENADCSCGGNPEWDLSNPRAELPDRDGAKKSEGAEAVNMRLLVLLCSVGAVEGADSVLLPCVFHALQHDLGLSLNKLAMLTMVQALAGQIAAPMWGVWADRGTFRRKAIIVFGCMGQGLITATLAGVDRMLPMMVLRALNGVMLASLRPIVNGVVAEIVPKEHHGKVYGGIGVAMNVGTMVGTIFGTNLGRRTVFGVHGWRLTFVILGGAGMLTGLAVALLMVEPARRKTRVEGPGSGPRRSRLRTVSEELGHLAMYFRMPSFCVLVLQGCFGSVPWNALSYKILFFQLAGVADWQASLIDVFSQVAGGAGGVLGGLVGDRLSRLSPYHGRPVAAQISVLAGLPIVWLLFKTAPPENGAFAYYLILMVALGLMATWCYAGVNLPILAQLVRDDRRATIMAWEGALEGSCASIFGNAMVGLLAQNMFGYDLNNAEANTKHGGNTQALGSALVLVSFFPWTLCFLLYSLLHWSYKRDVEWMQTQDANPCKAIEEVSAA